MTNMKRFLVLGILGLFMISMMAGVLGEDSSDEAAKAVADKAKQAGISAASFLNSFLGDEGLNKNENLSRVFFAILLALIVYTIIGTFFEGSSGWIRWGATISITVISLTTVPAEFLESIRISYGAMGASILAIIPFMIIAMFSVKVKDILIARFIWIFYCFYYFVLYIQAWISKGVFWGGHTFPYLVAIILGVLMFFFIGPLRHYIFSEDISRIKEVGEKHIERGKLLRELKKSELEEVYGGE